MPRRTVEPASERNVQALIDAIHYSAERIAGDISACFARSEQLPGDVYGQAPLPLMVRKAFEHRDHTVERPNPGFDDRAGGTYVLGRKLGDELFSDFEAVVFLKLDQPTAISLTPAGYQPRIPSGHRADDDAFQAELLVRDIAHRALAHGVGYAQTAMSFHQSNRAAEDRGMTF